MPPAFRARESRPPLAESGSDLNDYQQRAKAALKTLESAERLAKELQSSMNGEQIGGLWAELHGTIVAVIRLLEPFRQMDVDGLLANFERKKAAVDGIKPETVRTRLEEIEASVAAMENIGSELSARRVRERLSDVEGAVCGMEIGEHSVKRISERIERIKQLIGVMEKLKPEELTGRIEAIKTQLEALEQNMNALQERVSAQKEPQKEGPDYLKQVIFIEEVCGKIYHDDREVYLDAKNIAELVLDPRRRGRHCREPLRGERVEIELTPEISQLLKRIGVESGQLISIIPRYLVALNKNEIVGQELEESEGKCVHGVLGVRGTKQVHVIIGDSEYLIYTGKISDAIVFKVNGNKLLMKKDYPSTTIDIANTSESSRNDRNIVIAKVSKMRAQALALKPLEEQVAYLFNEVARLKTVTELP
jgi:hypothetical protein